MTVALRYLLALALIALPQWAAAAPVVLKFSYFTSDRSAIYQCEIKPFADAVNAEGAGLVEIKVYFSGAISPSIPDQAKLVMDGTADLAFIATGYVHDEFPDTSVMELPGLFANEQEASLVFTRLIEAGALQGYDRFFVPGAFVSTGENIHSRKPIARLADLRGQTIRVNNVIEASTLRRLGAQPELLPINRTMDALSKGILDGTTVPPAMVFEFGFGRLTESHFLLELGGAPSVLVMNRDKLASLPPRAQQIIRKYSGEWLAKQESACFAAKNHDVIAQLKASPQRKVVVPSEPDLAALREVYAGVVQAWADESPHNRELLVLVRSEIAKLRKETPR